MKNKIGVTAAKGFYSGGVASGIKKDGILDLAIIKSEVLAATAIVTTRNVVKAAPVLWDDKVVKTNPWTRAVVVNSGNANACTGEQGEKDVIKTAEVAAELLKVKREEVLISSTGVIGVPLPMDVLIDGIKTLSQTLTDDYTGGEKSSIAIMTTDLVPKTEEFAIELDNKTVTIGGMAKGSGMICPNMATMLSFITTDVAISPECLQGMLDEIVKDTYNMMSVDGDMSTNDTVIIMANGLAGNECIINSNSKGYQQFYEALYHVNEELAKNIVKDGEGATKFLEVIVNGAKDVDSARILGKSVINSSLVKTAFFGEDANWGRILAALGYSGIEFIPTEVDVRFESKQGVIDLMEQGRPLEFDEVLAAKILSEKEIAIHISIGNGTGRAVAWGCDLSYDYVKINGDYRT